MKLQFQVIQVLVVLQFEHLIDQCLSSRLDIGRRVFSTRPSPPPPERGLRSAELSVHSDGVLIEKEIM